MNKFKFYFKSYFVSFLEILSIKISTNIYTLLILGIGVYFYHVYCINSILFKDKINKTDKKDKTDKVLNYLDSINNSNKILFSKIDSLDLNKKEKLTLYYKTILKYDTLKITVDSMPPFDATLFLLSKSRQLTAEGIE
jgi:hypothetical protein